MGEIDEKKKERLMKKGRGRPWKNLLWFLLGFFTPTIIFAVVASILLWAVPISAIPGASNGFSEEIANGNIWNFVTNYKNYTIGDVPLIQDMLTRMIEDNNLDQYFTIDFEALKDIKLDQDSVRSFDYSKAITVTATVNSLNLGDKFGDLKNISAFTEWEEYHGEINTADPEFNPKLYYYRVSAGTQGLGLAVKDNKGNEYKRAFNDDKTLVEGAHPPYYLPALFDVGIVDMMDIMGERFQTCSATSLLEGLGVEPGSAIYDMVEGKTVGELANMDAESFYLKDFLNPISDYQDLYDIIGSAVNKEPEDILLGDLQNLDTQNIKLTDVLKNDDGSYDDILKILRSGTGVDTNDQLTLGKLKDLSVDNIHLNDVMKYEVDDPTTPEKEGNEDLYSILIDATKKPGDPEDYGPEDITLGRLSSGFNVDNIHLTRVLKDNEDTELIYNILRSATGKESNGEIVLSDLNNFNKDTILLKYVLENNAENEELYDILLSAVKREGATADDLTVGDLNGLDTKKINLTAVLDPTESKDLYDILLSALKDTYIDEDDHSLGKITVADDIRIEHLKDIKTNNVQLTSVLPLEEDDPLTPEKEGNESLYKVLCDVTGRVYPTDIDQIVVGGLSNFPTDNIHLVNVLPYAEADPLTPGDEGENETIYKILVNACGAASPEALTLEDLNGFSTDNIVLVDVMPLELDDPLTPEKEGNENLYKILCDVTSTPSHPRTYPDSVNEIKVSDLSDFNTDNIKLDTVLDSTDANNDKLYSILTDVTGKDADAITIADLSGFDTDNLHLVNVLPYVGNETLYKILVSSTGSTTYEDITVASLNDFETADILLTDVLPLEVDDPLTPGVKEGNENLYAILNDITGKPSNEITVGDLGDFDSGKIHLISVLDYDGNETLYSMLCDATGIPDYNDITIDDMNGASFDTGSIKLVNLIPVTDNPALYNILREATGAATNDDITVSALSGFDVNNVSLSTAIPNDTGNSIIDILREDDTVTIGNIGTKINNLSLSKVYGGDNVFTQDIGETNWHDTYDLNPDGSYTYNTMGTGEWYINRNSSVWLLFCYEAETINASNGRVTKFAPSELTFETLANDAGSLAGKITNSTIYNLMACGIITYDNTAADMFLKQTLQQVIDAAGAMF